MSSRSHWLIARIQSEGYCCLHAYLDLCEIRGEAKPAMARNIGMAENTIWHHYRAFREGKVVCQSRNDCMGPILDAICAEKNPVKPTPDGATTAGELD